MLAGLGQLNYEKDDFDTALRHFTNAEVSASAVGDDAIRAVALVGLGTVRRDLAEFAAARADLSTAAELGERIGDDSVVAAACYGLGVLSRDHGSIDEAGTWTRRSLDLYRKLDDFRGQALALRGLSLCHRARDEHAEAAELSDQAVTILDAAGDELGATYARQSLAKALIRLGRTDGVDELLARCLETCTRHRDRFGVALVTRTVGELRLALGDRAGAEVVLREALALWEELAAPLWQVRTLRDLAAATGSDALWQRARSLCEAVGGRESDELAAHTAASWYLQVRL